MRRSANQDWSAGCTAGKRLRYERLTLVQKGQPQAFLKLVVMLRSRYPRYERAANLGPATVALEFTPAIH